MKIKAVIIIMFIICVISKNVPAQNSDIKFTPISGVNGKPIGKIRNMTQDIHGYMWFAGEDEKCIYRYDGNKIIAFRHDESNVNSPGGNVINSVFADSSGIIWIGLGSGLDAFNPATGIFKHYVHIPGDTNSLSGGVTPVLRDHHGRLWAGTDYGLDLLDEKTGKFSHYRHDPANPKSLSDNIVWNIYEDHQGVIWVATGFPFFKKNRDSGGLNRLNDDGTFTRYMHDPKNPHSLISNKVRAMFEDSRGVFWVGTSGDGLHTLDRKTGQFERHLYNPDKPDQLSRPPLKKDEFAFENDQVTFITEDALGSIWIGSMWSGMNRYDTTTKKITHYEGSNGFSDSSAWNSFVSRDGMLWLSTQQNNLFRAGPFPKAFNNMNPGVPTLSFLEDRQGFLWTGTEENGLFQYDKQKKLLQHFSYNAVNQTNFLKGKISCLGQFQNDSIWLGTNDGIFILNTKTKQFSAFPLGFEFKDPLSSKIWSMYQDRYGIKWFATGEGIVNYNSKSGLIQRYQRDETDSGSINSDRVVYFLEDKAGELWVSVLNNGINRLNRQTNKFHHYLPGLNGICLYEDKEGQLWTGTNNGLFRYNRKSDQFLPFFDKESEFNREYIFGITEDHSRNLWITTPSAIIKINPERNKRSVYASKFGITRFSISPNATYTNSEGRILIGHKSGFYSFFPDEIDPPTSASKIAITDFFINNRLILPGENSPLQSSPEELSDLVLKYNQNNFAFNFALIDYRAPENTRYFTKLEGYDDTWREALGEKTSFYFNVSPGKNYVYHVKSIDVDGEEQEKKITIHIEPPWWQTTWFRIVSVFFCAMLLYGFIQFRSRSLKQRNYLLEKKVTERTNELNSSLAELKTTQDQLIQSEKLASLGELTSGIAHEIKNPLNFISNFSEINLDLITDIEEEQHTVTPINDENKTDANIKTLRKNLEKINHHSKRIDGIVKGMLQHSRLGNVNKEPVNINALCEDSIKLAFHGFRAKEKTFNASFETQFDPEHPVIMAIPQDLGRVLLNLFNNAFYTVNEKKKKNQSESSDEALQAELLYKPSVIVVTKKSDDKIIITVSDNGMGIPPSIINKIFQPFYTTKPTGEGTGLGLSMSYDIIVKSHKGELKVKSKEGVGTDFEIILPLK
jgi:signal transduction histidine kinase/ligand-binding sensor domain-containing protein